MKEFARPLEDDWQATLDAIARAHKWPTTVEVAKLGAAVRAMSDAYNANDERDAKGRVAAPLAARLGFGFARDVPKCAAAVRELIATGALAFPRDRALRVLDVGAGLGATTWGLARAMDAAKMKGEIDATWVDRDADVLAVGAEIVRARGGAGGVKLAVKTEARAAASGIRGAFDVVLFGQVLSELDPALDDAARAEKHAALVRDHLALVSEGGSLVVVEPALRDRTRHLHRVRDALLASAACTLFAPCLHSGPCPALAAEGDWCHEDRPIDLPAWLAPVAREAGLRWQGLTFSYVVLRRDARTLVASMRKGGARLRVVSGRIETKGKIEVFVCGEHPTGGGRVRAMRLDRDESSTNRAWESVERGDLIAIDPPLDAAKPRVLKEARVTISELEKGAPPVDGARGPE